MRDPMDEFRFGESPEHPGGDDPVGSAQTELIDSVRLAAMLSISTRTLYRLKKQGCLPSPIRLGGSTRWRRRDVLRWIDRGCPREGPS